ncbi:MAG: ROK family protein [Clostridia bacterium]|nr:ROK family protein [Clostridia bacterium]
MYYIGIDLGGTNIAVGVVNEEGKIICKKSIPTLAHRTPEEIVKDMASVSMEVVKEAGLSMDDITSLGAACPCFVEKKLGVLIAGANLPFRGYDIRKELHKYIDKPIYLDNDANCAAWAEAVAGAAKGTKDSIMITLGTGVGGGIVVNGSLYSGFNCFGGELGHMVIEIDGRQCGCGRKGCWEAYASATALIKMTREYAENNKNSLMWELAEKEGKFSGRTAFDAAKQGDETAQKVVDKYIKYLTCGVANLITIFQPEVLVIGGGVSNEGEYLLEPLRKAALKEKYDGTDSPLFEDGRIEKALLGNDAGIIGAALLKE